MSNIHIPDTKDIYNIAVLVKAGWTYYGGGWTHPEKKKYIERNYVGDAVSESELWSYEGACDETDDCCPY